MKFLRGKVGCGTPHQVDSIISSITFYDKDGDEWLSVGDVFILKGEYYQSGVVFIINHYAMQREMYRHTIP